MRSVSRRVPGPACRGLGRHCLSVSERLQRVGSPYGFLSSSEGRSRAAFCVCVFGSASSPSRVLLWRFSSLADLLYSWSGWRLLALLGGASMSIRGDTLRGCHGPRPTSPMKKRPLPARADILHITGRPACDGMAVVVPMALQCCHAAGGQALSWRCRQLHVRVVSVVDGWILHKAQSGVGLC